MERTGDVGNDVEKYIIVNPKTGKGVQSWDFSEPKHIVYCRSPEWTMKFDKEDGASRSVKYLSENFPGQVLQVMKVVIRTEIEFG